MDPHLRQRLDHARARAAAAADRVAAAHEQSARACERNAEVAEGLAGTIGRAAELRREMADRRAAALDPPA